MKTKIVSLLFIVTLLQGCTTTYNKAGCTDEDFARDMAIAEMHADSEIRNATLMPAQSGLEVAMRGIATPILRRKSIKDYMKRLGWEAERQSRNIQMPQQEAGNYQFMDLNPKPKHRTEAELLGP